MEICEVQFRNRRIRVGAHSVRPSGYSRMMRAHTVRPYMGSFTTSILQH